MKWSLSLLAVPLLYFLSVPWVAMLEMKLHGSVFITKNSHPYYLPWKWAAKNHIIQKLERRYAEMCDPSKGEPYLIYYLYLFD